MYSSSINMSYISLEPFLISTNVFYKRWFARPQSYTVNITSSGQVDRTASLISWNVVNGGVELYFCWKSYKVMKSTLFVKRSWINVIPESCHFLIKMGLLSIWMKQLYQSGDFKTAEILRFGSKEKKEEIWLSPVTKAHTPTEMSKGQSDNINNATKKFDYTAVADRLRTVSWSNYSHPTGVVNRFTGPPSH